MSEQPEQSLGLHNRFRDAALCLERSKDAQFSDDDAGRKLQAECEAGRAALGEVLRRYENLMVNTIEVDDAIRRAVWAAIYMLEWERDRCQELIDTGAYVGYYTLERMTENKAMRVEAVANLRRAFEILNSIQVINIKD